MKPQRLLRRIQQGEVNNIRFSDFVRLVKDLGFVLRRTEGSHRIYKHPDLAENSTFNR